MLSTTSTDAKLLETTQKIGLEQIDSGKISIHFLALKIYLISYLGPANSLDLAQGYDQIRISIEHYGRNCI